MKKTVAELSKKSVGELTTEAKALREAIALTRLEKKITTVKDTNIISKKKKRLAIVMTFINKKHAEIKS